jgi:hypothetical protein
MNQHYLNFLMAIHNRDVTYAWMLVVILLGIAGYQFILRVPVPFPVFRKVLVVVYWASVSLTYIVMIVVASMF